MTRARAVLALLLLFPATSHAQVTIRGFGDAGVTIFSATQSFKAIFDRPSGPVYGGGVELGLPKHVFLSVSASRFRRTGHRVFVFEGQTFTLNDPATITITPLDFTVGYRLTKLSRLRPYGGGGGGLYTYDETSAHSIEGDDVHKRYTGYHALGGAEVPLANFLAIAAETQFASVPNALGKESTSVSSVYNEHNLGGFTFRVKVIIGR